MFVVRTKRTYGALISTVAVVLCVPFITLRHSLPSVANGLLLIGVGGVVIGLLVMFRPPKVITADPNGVTFYSRLFLGTREWQCPWAYIDSVRGEQRLLAGPDGPADVHLVFLRLSAPAGWPQSRGEIGGLTSGQIPELGDPHMMIWSLIPPAMPVADVGAQLSAYLERARR